MPRPARSMEDWLETRDALLRAGMSVLAERGIEGLTIEAVANRARVSKGTVQYNLGSKEQLIADLARALLMTTYGAGVGRGELPGGRGIAASLARGMVDDPPRLSALVSLISSAPRLGAAKAVLAAYYATLDEDIVPVLVEEGVPEEDAVVLSRMIRALVLGANTHWLIDPRGRDLHEVADEVERCVEVLVTGFRARRVALPS